MSLFTLQNWNHVQYTNGKHRALVSMGAELTGDIIYFMSVIDENDLLIFQSEHHCIEKACEVINDKFQDFWDFSDLANNQDQGGGCGSCNAH